MAEESARNQWVQGNAGRQGFVFTHHHQCTHDDLRVVDEKAIFERFIDGADLRLAYRLDREQTADGNLRLNTTVGRAWNDVLSSLTFRVTFVGNTVAFETIAFEVLRSSRITTVVVVTMATMRRAMTTTMGQR